MCGYIHQRRPFNVQVKSSIGSRHRKLPNEKSQLFNQSKRLRVVFTADLLETGGAHALLVDLENGEMHQNTVRRRAVPMSCIRQNHRGIAGMELLHFSLLQLNAFDTGDTIERLNNGM